MKLPFSEMEKNSFYIFSVSPSLLTLNKFSKNRKVIEIMHLVFTVSCFGVNFLEITHKYQKEFYMYMYLRSEVAIAEH